MVFASISLSNGARAISHKDKDKDKDTYIVTQSRGQNETRDNDAP